MDGVAHLQEILNGFKTDLDYSTADESPLKSIMDLCLDIRDRKHGEKSLPVFMKNAQSANPNISAISIVCLKGNQAHSAVASLKVLARVKRSP
jgi:hypothetical protein